MDVQNRVMIQTHWLVKAIAIIGFLMGGLFVYLWATGTSTDGWKIALMFGFLGMLLWVLASSYIEMTDQYVFVQVPYGRFKIDWDEVKQIDTNGTYYAFIGNDKRIVIAMSLMSSSQKQMYELMNLHIGKRNIEVRQSTTIPMTHKNSRVTH
jgi:hypothetical protein